MSWRLNSALERSHLVVRLVNIFSGVFPQPPSPHTASWQSRQEFWMSFHLYKTQQTPNNATNITALPAHVAVSTKTSPNSPFSGATFIHWMPKLGEFSGGHRTRTVTSDKHNSRKSKEMFCFSAACVTSGISCILSDLLSRSWQECPGEQPLKFICCWTSGQSGNSAATQRI